MWTNFVENIMNIVSIVKITDILDIFLVAFIIYKILMLVRDTKAVQLFRGIIILLVVMQISYIMNLHAINYILRNAMQIGVLAILIIFQPEIRRALERMGRSSISTWFNFEEQGKQISGENAVSEISRAVESLSKSKTGALIVIEKGTKLGDIIDTGILLKADISTELLINIFEPNTPLHDGAAVIRNGKIEAAACFLPLTQNPDIGNEFGTRHRAGVGVSEECDAVVIIVSEETGQISLAINGELKRGHTGKTIASHLTSVFEPEHEKKRGILNWRKNSN